MQPAFLKLMQDCFWTEENLDSAAALHVVLSYHWLRKLVACENLTRTTLSYDSLLCKTFVTLTSSLTAHRCDPCVHGDVLQTCSACGVPPPFFAFPSLRSPTFDHIFSLNIIVMFHLCQTPMPRTQVPLATVNRHPARNPFLWTVSGHVSQIRKLRTVIPSKSCDRRFAPSGFS